MGRNYRGDIEGKFWFAVQNSDDASFFGGEEFEPNYLEYYFSEDDLPNIKKGIKDCKQNLGKTLKKLDTFFKVHESYTDKQLSDHLGLGTGAKGGNKFTMQELHDILSWYARLELGKKILECVEKNGECRFDAEL